MYEAFYGFREKPFNLTPDPKFLYLSGKHNEAFAHLEFGLSQRGGFIVITGEVGTGKTTLCRYFLDRLDDTTLSAFILYPSLGTTELLRSINRDLGVETRGESDKELIDALHAFLLESRLHQKNIVLVIDEAQNLSRDVLEQVRLISNLETATEKLIQIVLMGQSELNDVLAKSDLRQLAQRVTARYHLSPLSRKEMTRYIRHRLAVAGGLGGVDFTPGAMRLIHRVSKGIPRLINLVCDRSLLAGYVLEENEIGRGIVRRAVKELHLDGESRRRLLPRWAAVATVLVVAAAGIGFSSWLSRPRALVANLLDDRSRTSAEPFELRLLTISEELSRRAASAVLLEQWGIRWGANVAEISALEDMPSLAKRAALQYSELDTNVAQLQALDVPAVLELFHPARERAVYATLTALDGEYADMHFAPGDFLRVPIGVLHRFWKGRARLFWRDFDGLESADAESHFAWARVRLEALGFLDGVETESVASVAEALKELQKRVLLDPTGEVGHETRMALYSLGHDYRMPRLSTP